MHNKRLLYFATALSFSLLHSLRSMDDFNKGFREGMGKEFAKSFSNNDKGFLDYALNLLWINFILGPSTNVSQEVQVKKSYEDIVDFKPRARFLTKLVKNNDTYNFIRQKEPIQNKPEIELEGLRLYQKYLEQQAFSPYAKSIQKIATNALFYGTFTTILGISSYYCFKYSFNTDATDFNLFGGGIVLGLSTLLSGLFTKERIKKHMPSSITNRKNKKIEDVQIAINWATSIRDHLDNTNLILRK